MKIIESSENLTVRDVYLLTNNPKSRKMGDARGETIPVSKWCIFEDVNKKTGEVQELLAVDTGKMEAFFHDTTTGNTMLPSSPAWGR